MKQGSSTTCLVADIGGTNARFALVDIDGVEPRHTRVLACSDYHTLVDAVLAYIEDAAVDMPALASFAIATPVSHDRVVMTNHVWDLSIDDTRNKLGLSTLKVINDYTALSLSLPYLQTDDYRQVGGGSCVDKQTMAVIGPGTGLGVSGAVYADSYWLPLQGEGGHVAYNPASEREAEIFTQIRKRRDFVSAESLVSGPGLVLLYESISKLKGEHHRLSTPQSITRDALSGNSESAKEALDMMCGVLGAVAGDLALTLGARGGVYIGGGIIPRIGKFFDASPFRQRFESKGRFSDYVSGIATRVIVSEFPALTGAAIAMRPHYDGLGCTSQHGDKNSNAQLSE